MLMVHKPMSICVGNSDDMLKAAEDLEAIQEGTCMPIYRSKLKADEDELKALIKSESWLSAQKAADIFDIDIIHEQKDVKNSMEASVVAKYGYKNVPEQLITPAKEPVQTAKVENQPQETAPPVDYSEWENRINNIGGRS